MFDGLREAAQGLIHRRALRRWARAAARAETLDLPRLRVLRGRAREIRRRVDRFLHVAEGRLTLPVIGSNAIRKPLHTDWAYRPELWRGPVSPRGVAAAENRTALGTEARIYHDCAISEVTLRQVRNTREEDLAPFGLRVDVFRFDGTFLSLVIDLPQAAVENLTRDHIIEVTTVVEEEKPLELFARLNIQHGPNVEQIVLEFPLDRGPEAAVAFDLAYTDINEKRVERMWLDLIFEGPEMNQVLLRDVTLTRRPRAGF
ncbi:MAG: hypothetical protein D6688_06580 [Alphaproteobacteria bacterium]|nr:MAG: hypothetical protein D6688_06580 [Alphaproteobacteria bacterium]